MPSTPLMCSSSGVATVLATVSGLAPGNNAVTMTDGGTTSVKVLMDRQDWYFATLKTPAAEAAKWSMSPSGAVSDGPGFPGATFKNGCYRGYE
jgi:hypothetical protein